ncbi:hypothetical protein LCGC14_1798900 [marine sediment metagenome]|uniref:Uncharacterized protein n=1 Tax=marine sediment metagenome TaxID=412755 RepID=A0A0F9HCY0_9ZZZZ
MRIYHQSSISGPTPNMDRELETIYVYLENEGTDVWRPVKAERLRVDVYRIVSPNEDPDDEQWQFKTADVVRCESKLFSGGETGLVAVERLFGTI